ncbi:MAG TPA: choice-of-anchor Q domain-containing protein, partial [Opitutaceae bacterium]|nr:choice-of-anchor Q domain-containing protein [Opitutaceae bacterium]
MNGDTIDVKGITGTITLLPQPSTSSQLEVTTSVTILGPGPASLTINGNQTGRVFRIFPELTVTIDGFTIANGLATGSPQFSFPPDAGAGIFNERSALSVNNCVISGNSAVEAFNFSSSGGGIFNIAAPSGHATLTLTNSIVSGNSAGSSAGIANVARDSGVATLDVENSTISGNSADLTGGISNSAFNGATATTAIIASTISGNTVRFNNGAITNNGLGGGNATLILSDSTVSGNMVFGEFGDNAGIHNINGGLVRINSCTFSGNTLSDPARHGGAIATSDGTVEIGKTILRAGAIGENLFLSFAGGRIISRGFNLSSDDGGGFLTAATDRINTDPMLGPLADNGGPTLTHLPLLGSPAIDQGSSDGLIALGITTDQRGFARTVDDPAIDPAFLGDNTDIGAVEVAAAPPPPPPTPVADVGITFLGADKLSVKQGEVLTYTIAVRNFGPDAAPNVVVNSLMSSGTGFLNARATKGNFVAPPVNESGAVIWTLGDMANGAAEGAEL